MTFEQWFKTQVVYTAESLHYLNESKSWMRVAYDAATQAERERICVFLETHGAAIDMRGSGETRYVIVKSYHSIGGHHDGMTYADAIRKGDA